MTDIVKNTKPFSLSGRMSFRIRSLINLTWASILVPLRRLVVGPRGPGWKLFFEIANHSLRMQNIQAFERDHVAESRELLDTIVYFAPALDAVKVAKLPQPIRGYWITPPDPHPEKIILYFHGGGYVYFARAYFGIIANIAQSAGVKIFALDYPLTPENPYPAQLNRALETFDWLLKEGYSSKHITIMGDSAGGNLTLALLLNLKQMDRPMPSSAVCISPWTDVGNSGRSMYLNEPFDWVQTRMAEQWTRWFLNGHSDKDPLISPIHADLTGLPPIYVQAGGKEILIDMILQFCENAKSQGADIRLDVWENMNHDFQAYGDLLAEAQQALDRIAQFIHTKPGAV